ncbi:MAG: HK97 family phage prohead protease [Ignavibacteriae bacterium]|nr:HK97 family phage prohead protease [Ignavibacteriota bacterium]
MEYKNFIITEKSFNDKDMTITHYISTVTPDRFGDIVNPFGMDADNFRKNPIVLFGHSHNARTNIIGKNILLAPDDFGVKAMTKFADTSAGKDIYNLNKEGYLNAWSIGFIPKKTKIQNTTVNNQPGTYNIIDEWELLEYSSVAIPANPDALNLMYKEIKSPEILHEINFALIRSELDSYKVSAKELSVNLEKLEEKTAKKLKEIINLIRRNRMQKCN